MARCSGFAPVGDTVPIARLVWETARGDLVGAMRSARNGRKLLSIPDLAGDVPFSLQLDTVDLVAVMTTEGMVKRWEASQGEAG